MTVSRGNTPSLISLGGPITRPNLAAVMGQNTGYALGTPEMSVCVVLQPALLEQMLQSANFHRNGIILIYGEGDSLWPLPRKSRENWTFPAMKAAV